MPSERNRALERPGQAARLGQVNGSVLSARIDTTEISTVATGGNAGILVGGSNFARAVILESNSFDGWPTAVQCGGTASNLFFAPNNFSSVTTNYSNCNAINIQGDTLTNAVATNPINVAAVLAGTKSFEAPNYWFSTIYAVAGTPLPGAGVNPHASACVSDATVCTLGTTYVGSSGTNCHVHSNGANWIEDGFGC